MNLNEVWEYDNIKILEQIKLALQKLWLLMHFEVISND